MPYYCGGDLHSYVTKQSKLSENEAAFVCASVAYFISEAHSRNVMHRDLKPENILLGSKDSVEEILITDFGLATFFVPGIPAK